MGKFEYRRQEIKIKTIKIIYLHMFHKRQSERERERETDRESNRYRFVYHNNKLKSLTTFQILYYVTSHLQRFIFFVFFKI